MTDTRTPCPDDRPLRLTDADCLAIFGALDAPTPILPIPPRHRLWTWLVSRVPYLHRYQGTGQVPSCLPITDEDRARLLAMLCDQQTREAVLALLAGGIRAIARDEGAE